MEKMLLQSCLNVLNCRCLDGNLSVIFNSPGLLFQRFFIVLSKVPHQAERHHNELYFLSACGTRGRRTRPPPLYSWSELCPIQSTIRHLPAVAWSFTAQALLAAGGRNLYVVWSDVILKLVPNRLHGSSPFPFLFRRQLNDLSFT